MEEGWLNFLRKGGSSKADEGAVGFQMVEALICCDCFLKLLLGHPRVVVVILVALVVVEEIFPCGLHDSKMDVFA